MKANKDSKIEIKEVNRDYFHIEHTRIIRDSTGKHPETNFRIMTYSRKEWTALQQFVARNGLGALNDDELRIVHDPTIEVKVTRFSAKCF